MGLRLSPELAYSAAYEEHAYLEVYALLENLPKNLFYHKRSHTLEYVYPQALRLARTEGISPDNRLLLATAALFHDTGFLDQYAANEPFGAARGREYAGQSYNRVLRQGAQTIYEAIVNTNMKEPPKNLIERILRDADLSVIGMPEFHHWNDNLRWECRKHEKESPAMYEFATDDKKWATSQLAFLEKQTWFTASARRLYENQKQENIALFKRMYANSLR